MSTVDPDRACPHGNSAASVEWAPPGAPSEPPQSVIVTLHLGDPETGIWCPHCLLPSAVRWPIVADKPRLFPAGRTVTVCQDCSAQIRDVPA